MSDDGVASQFDALARHQRRLCLLLVHLRSERPGADEHNAQMDDVATVTAVVAANQIAERLHRVLACRRMTRQDTPRELLDDGAQREEAQPKAKRGKAVAHADHE